MADEEGFYLKDFKEVSEHIRIIRALIRDFQSDIQKISMRLEKMEGENEKMSCLQ
jgi:hypothetical protein